jgi:hypothetical protein
MSAITKEFTVLDVVSGKSDSAVGYSQAVQKAVNSLDKNDVAVVVIRITKEKASNEKKE